MKLHEKCELSNLFSKETFHFRLDFRQTRILNIATATKLEIVRLEEVDLQVFWVQVKYDGSSTSLDSIHPY